MDSSRYRLLAAKTNTKATSGTSCVSCPDGSYNPAGDNVYPDNVEGSCTQPPPSPPAPPSEPECGSVAPTSHSLLTDSCAACFAGFYTSNSSVYYDCHQEWIYYFSPEYVTFDGSQPTWNGGAYLNHMGGEIDPAGDWLYSSTWMYAASRDVQRVQLQHRRTYQSGLVAIKLRRHRRGGGVRPERRRRHVAVLIGRRRLRHEPMGHGQPLRAGLCMRIAIIAIGTGTNASRIGTTTSRRPGREGGGGDHARLHPRRLLRREGEGQG